MKLIDLLVKDLPKWGGWPENVTHIGQDYDRELMFYGRGNVASGIIIDELAIDHRKSGEIGVKITREQYESALAASKAVVGHDGWIQWAGGDCPVDSDAIVEVRYRKPNPYQFNNDRAGDFNWSHDGFDGDIIAYRVHTPDANPRANDDRLEQDLNECIGQDIDIPEWNGEGLPPVGIKCEHCPGGTTQHEWEIVTVAGVHENTSTGFTDYWLVRENGSSYIVGNPYRFRPLRTEAEMAREKLAASLHIAAGASPIELNGIGTLYFKLADAIISGSVFGTTFKAGK